MQPCSIMIEIMDKNKNMLSLHKDYNDIAKAAQNAVLAIGNFDGLHLGHRSLITAVQDIAKDIGAPSAVMTFEPHPREFFAPEAEPFRLTLLPMKQRVLSSWGLDHLIALDFNQQLASLSADEFIDKVLVQGLSAKHIVVGRDFAFGAKRSGNTQTLQAAAEAGKFGLSLIEPALCGSAMVYSSTRIRDLIRGGDFVAAAHHLGRPFSVEAPVIHGNKRGRELGYPTANQDVTRYTHIPFGVYAVRVRIEGEETVYGGAANFGIRPMFAVEKPLLETFIFDFDRDLYGKTINVTPIAHIRPEMRFDSLDALKIRMKQDCADARAMLKCAEI